MRRWKTKPLALDTDDMIQSPSGRLMNLVTEGMSWRSPCRTQTLVLDRSRCTIERPYPCWKSCGRSKSMLPSSGCSVKS